MLNVRASRPSASPATMGLELTGPSAEMDCVAGSEISGVEDHPLTGTTSSCGPVGDWNSTMRLSASYQVSCVGPDTSLPMGTVGPRAAPPPGTARAVDDHGDAHPVWGDPQLADHGPGQAEPERDRLAAGGQHPDPAGPGHPQVAVGVPAKRREAPAVRPAGEPGTPPDGAVVDDPA